MVLIDGDGRGNGREGGAGPAGGGSAGGGSARPVRAPRPTSTLAAAVEGADVLDGAAGAVGRLAGAVAGEGRRRDLLSGTWLGHPVHPLLVTLPIGMWGAASLLDVTGQRRAAQTLVGAGIVSTAPTALTGMSDWAYTTGAERRVGLVHMVANTVAVAVYTASWRARRQGRQGRGAVLALAGAAIAGAGGWLGGHLSYSLGVGVDTNAFDGGPSEWTPLKGDIPAAGPPPGTGVQARADGTAVLVANDRGTLRALADRCSHRGGPLSDGEIADGCVTCPWHGGRFDLATGEVVAGPAVVPQPVYDVRRSVDGDTGGHWEVRRDEERSLRSNAI